jgi:hypothetical protein
VEEALIKVKASQKNSSPLGDYLQRLSLQQDDLSRLASTGPDATSKIKAGDIAVSRGGHGNEES